MASKTERAVINVAGLVQGIVLVTFPAASTIFTAKSDYGLSSIQYGDMFLPQVLTARITYHILPFVLAAAFVLLRVLPSHDAIAGIAVFGLAGLGCSALLPLTISFGEEELTAVSAAVAGGVIAFYQLGYGIAAFGVGPLQHAGLNLSAIFGGTAIVAAALAVLSFVVSPVRPRRQHRQHRATNNVVSRPS